MGCIHAHDAAIRDARGGRDQRQFLGLEITAWSAWHRERHTCSGVVAVATNNQHRQKNDGERGQHGGANQPVFQGGVHQGGSERPERRQV
jgi:hypothetical protein